MKHNVHCHRSSYWIVPQRIVAMIKVARQVAVISDYS